MTGEEAYREAVKAWGSPPLPPKPNRKVIKIAERVADVMARAEREKMDREIDNMVKRMSNLSIYGNDNDMDTSNMVDGSVILTDADGNEYMAFVTRGLKKK